MLFNRRADTSPPSSRADTVRRRIVGSVVVESVRRPAVFVSVRVPYFIYNKRRPCILLHFIRYKKILYNNVQLHQLHQRQRQLLLLHQLLHQRPQERELYAFICVHVVKINILRNTTC
jgi:hypothetical protein